MNYAQTDALVGMVESSGAIQYTERSAEKHVELTINVLNALPKYRYLETHEQLAEFAVSRRR